jgi:hypothetical protein
MRDFLAKPEVRRALFGATIGLIVGAIAGGIAERIQLAIGGRTGIHAAAAAYGAIWGVAMAITAAIALGHAKRTRKSVWGGWLIVACCGVVGGLAGWASVWTDVYMITDWIRGAGFGALTGALLGWCWEAMNTKTAEDNDQTDEKRTSPEV